MAEAVGQSLRQHLDGAQNRIREGDRLGVIASMTQAGLDQLPLPGAGGTLQRWQALAAVAQSDLALVKLYEGHTDALATMAELDAPAPPLHSTWGLWAAEARDIRVISEPCGAMRVKLAGRKAWCSGASGVTHALLTTWRADGRGPFLAAVEMAQPAVRVTGEGWQAVGMAGSASVDVEFDGAIATEIGSERAYLDRPGFWHGGCGIAACWHGGAVALAETLRRAVPTANAASRPYLLSALGSVDVALQCSAALMRDAARWIDAHPRDDAMALALRVRGAAEAAAAEVLKHAGRALGAGPFCRDPHFARMAADLPVFVRQSHAERDLAALGDLIAAAPREAPWTL